MNMGNQNCVVVKYNRCYYTQCEILSSHMHHNTINSKYYVCYRFMVYGYMEQVMTESGVLTEANFVGDFFTFLMKLLSSAEGKRILNQ
jgi:hypothetical protein